MPERVLGPSLPLTADVLRRAVELAWLDGAYRGAVAGLIAGLLAGCALGYLLGRDRSPR